MYRQAIEFPMETGPDLQNTISVPHPMNNRARRAQQMRLDACLSPSKSTSVAPSANAEPNQMIVVSKSTGSLSLKQLLRTGPQPEICLTSKPPSTLMSPAKCQNQTTASPPSSLGLSSDHAPVSRLGSSRTDQQLATFYARSRLHHLSSWANELHQLVTRIRDNPDHQCDLGEAWKQKVLCQSGTDSIVTRLVARQSAGASSSRPPSPPSLPRIVFHIDMDCFFVSVSLRNRLDLKDKPVAVTHAKYPESEHQSNPSFGCANFCKEPNQGIF
ncbi:unnamed protein product [Echinostoma caproni]|uniref:UmuC domain-containing protein n=1 Tax=Echinostoma caproni TaxID=27848 RepID=A0A183AVY2_9TREM|nr:unnamed protein product [Echinostoma caproni]